MALLSFDDDQLTNPAGQDKALQDMVAEFNKQTERSQLLDYLNIVKYGSIDGANVTVIGGGPGWVTASAPVYHGLGYQPVYKAYHAVNQVGIQIYEDLPVLRTAGPASAPFTPYPIYNCYCDSLNIYFSYENYFTESFPGFDLSGHTIFYYIFGIPMPV